MKTITTPLFIAGLLVAAGLPAFAQDTPAEVGGTAETSEFRTFDPTEEEWETFRSSGEITHQGGEAVYNSVCAGCHMPDGEGAVGAGVYPALAGNEALAAPAYPIFMVLEGQGAMPPFGSILDDQQIADVVDYIRSNFGNDFIEEWGEASAAEVSEMRQ